MHDVEAVEVTLQDVTLKLTSQLSFLKTRGNGGGVVSDCFARVAIALNQDGNVRDDNSLPFTREGVPFTREGVPFTRSDIRTRPH